MAQVRLFGTSGPEIAEIQWEYQEMLILFQSHQFVVQRSFMQLTILICPFLYGRHNYLLLTQNLCAKLEKENKKPSITEITATDGHNIYFITIRKKVFSSFI